VNHKSDASQVTIRSEIQYRVLQLAYHVLKTNIPNAATPSAFV